MGLVRTAVIVAAWLVIAWLFRRQAWRVHRRKEDVRIAWGIDPASLPRCKKTRILLGVSNFILVLGILFLVYRALV